ncbi:MAG: helix-turn-helix domain-containing protein, partial [Lactococcus cremoris]
MRQLAGFKYKDLESIMSKNGIVRLENGTSNISFERLAELLKFMGYTLSDFMYL